MPDSRERHLEDIARVFPAEITRVDVHAGGDDFLVLEINRAWMFRFPRREVSRRALRVETAFLAGFRSRSPLPVPEHRYVGKDFVGYAKIEGRLLSLELFRGLTPGGRARLAEQIGGFLSAVHGFPVDEARGLGVTPGWDGWQEKGLRAFREQLAPQLTPGARRSALACLERMCAHPGPVKVLHGDFALQDHVFYDQPRGEISGVIDFADVTLDDPAHDFQNILEYGGEEFFAAVLRHYPGGPDPGLLERTRRRIEARPMLEAAYASIFGFADRFQERMNWIESHHGRP